LPGAGGGKQYISLIFMMYFCSKIYFLINVDCFNMKKTWFLKIQKYGSDGPANVLKTSKYHPYENRIPFGSEAVGRRLDVALKK